MCPTEWPWIGVGFSTAMVQNDSLPNEQSTSSKCTRFFRNGDSLSPQCQWISIKDMYSYGPLKFPPPWDENTPGFVSKKSISKTERQIPQGIRQPRDNRHGWKSKIYNTQLTKTFAELRFLTLVVRRLLLNLSEIGLWRSTCPSFFVLYHNIHYFGYNMLS